MRALITGANGDIGNAILTYLLEEAYTVLAIDKHTERLTSSAKSTVLPLDLTRIDEIENHLPTDDIPFDVLVYAAGIREITPAIQLSLTDWRSVLDVNLTSAFIISQYAARLALKYQHPLCIIFIASISGLFGEPERSAYCASKHGLIGLSKALSMELAPFNIRVNAIAPGIIETDLTRPYQQSPTVMKQLNDNIPLQRWGRPHHIVQTVDFIIKNDYLTGSTLVVDGGWTAGKNI